MWSRLGKSLDIRHLGKPDFPSAMETLNLPPCETRFLPRWWRSNAANTVYYLSVCDVRTRDAVFPKTRFARLCSCRVWQWGYNHSTRGKLMTNLCHVPSEKSKFSSILWACHLFTLSTLYFTPKGAKICSRQKVRRSEIGISLITLRPVSVWT